MQEQALEPYRAAIREQFGLAASSISYLSEGWDSVACLVDERLVFRFPKRASVQRRLQREISLLPLLAARLPLPIPQFRYIGQPDAHFPYIFVGYERLAGDSVMEWPDQIWQADWWQQPLAAFVTALHAVPLEQARAQGVGNFSLVGPLLGIVDEPPSWRAMIEDYHQQTRQRVYPLIDGAAQAALSQRFESFLADQRNFAFTSVLLHADLGEDHVLIDAAARRVTGVIDFGDMAIGDPALDVWPRLLPHYGGQTDPGFERRHRFYRRFGPLNAILFGQSHAEAGLIQQGLEALAEDLSRASPDV